MTHNKLLVRLVTRECAVAASRSDAITIVDQFNLRLQTVAVGKVYYMTRKKLIKKYNTA